MRISDWSSDVCSSDLVLRAVGVDLDERGLLGGVVLADLLDDTTIALGARVGDDDAVVGRADLSETLETDLDSHDSPGGVEGDEPIAGVGCASGGSSMIGPRLDRSEEHTSELQSLMRISYAVFCLKKKK